MKKIVNFAPFRVQTFGFQTHLEDEDHEYERYDDLKEVNDQRDQEVGQGKLPRSHSFLSMDTLT